MPRVKKNSYEQYDSPFASRLRGLLDAPGMNQSKLADHIGVTRQAISAWSLGISLPDIEKFGLIADFFDVSTEFLLGRTDISKANWQKHKRASTTYTRLLPGCWDTKSPTRQNCTCAWMSRSCGPFVWRRPMPKPTVIDGAHAALLDEFVVYKRNLGYGYPKQTLELIRLFSRFLAGFPEEKTILTKELAEAFCAPREGEAVSTRNKRFSVVRQFALFLQSKGIPCHVPPEHHDKASTEFVPYIITEEQIETGDTLLLRCRLWLERNRPNQLRYCCLKSH